MIIDNSIYTVGTFPAVYSDLLQEAPHILIAGATGAGKSTCLNGLIYTALHRDIDLVCVDPKRVELYRYRRIAAFYADDTQTAEYALKLVLGAIEERNKEMQRQGLLESQEKPIYLVVDELADLLLTSKQAKKDLIRILQLGRAARVSCICCTQNVLARVLSTELLVNLNYRIALMTATAAHSRLIIGVNGCEKLPFPRKAGFAEMYIYKPGGIELYYMNKIPETSINELIEYRYQEQKQLKKPLNKLKRFLKGLFK